MNVKREDTTSFDNDCQPYFQSFFENATDAILLFDLQGNVLRMNKAGENLYGWDKEDTNNQTHCLLSKESHREFAESLRKLSNEESISYESKRIHKDGSILYIQSTLSPINNDVGDVVAVASIERDNTVQNKEQAKTQKSYRRFRRMVLQSPNAIIIHVNNRVEYINPAGVGLIGASSGDELEGCSILNLIHPDDHEQAQAISQKIQESDTTTYWGELKFIRFNHQVVVGEVSHTRIVYRGCTGIQTTILDVTERRKVEAELRKSEEKYRLIAENSSDLIKIVDLSGIITYASPSHQVILGIDPDEVTGSSIFDFIHKEDLENIQGNVVSGRIMKSFEWRCQHKEGFWIWMESNQTPVKGKDNETLHFVIVSRDITERKKLEEKLTHLAYHDQLTGLPNRRMFNEHFENALSRAKRHLQYMSIIFLDCDNFKEINDQMGHDMGDEVLKGYAERIQRVIRDSDIVARLGGDEFVILLSDIPNIEEIPPVLNRLYEVLQEPWHTNGLSFSVTSSIGASIYPHDGEDIETLIKRSDQAQYRAKTKGKNNFSLYSSHL